MSEMLERVARALHNADLVAEGKPVISDRGWETVWRTGLSRSLKVSARAAIETMREPTAAMIEAMDIKDGEFNISNSVAVARKAWQDAVDAALS